MAGAPRRRSLPAQRRDHIPHSLIVVHVKAGVAFADGPFHADLKAVRLPPK
jgi:hypothetical protein